MNVSSKLINGVFSLLFMASIGLVICVFFVWNEQDKAEGIELVNNNDKLNYWVDKCAIDEDRQTISVSGWGYLDGMPYIKHEVYVKSRSGGFYKLNTLRVQRPDTREVLGLDERFDNIGFSSSLKVLSKNDFSNEIVFTMRGPYGKKANVEYTCK